MHLKNFLHEWDVTPTEAVRLQRSLAGKLVHPRLPRGITEIAGVDVSSPRGGDHVAAVVVYSLQTGRVTQVAVARVAPSFPYVPGLLTFREGPVVLRVLAKLECEPRAVMFDGQGIAHPRRMGLAAHMGLWLDVPTVGIAKSLLRGRFREPREKAGSTSALMLDGEQVGCVVRTRSSVRPVFVSPGDKLGITGAVRLTLRCCSGLRIPEPTRLAHIAAGAARSRGLEGEQLLQHVNTFARPPK